ncbi:site-specific integrase [Pedobacter nanyangensis]|uniref:site-specific integrase n=1 Tax=Pedobacter nanyangensis TaxID=1562389 RepID=UPI0013B41932|nr:site-specific integrase [Pedobacter nanyangensis]
MKVNEKLSILLMLEKARTTKDGKSPITVRLTVDGKRAELSLGQKINANMWSQDAGMARGSSQEARLINTVIDRVKGKLRQHYDLLSSRYDYVSAAMVKEAFQGKTKRQNEKTLLQAFDFVIERMGKKVEKGLRARPTLVKLKGTRDKVCSFLKKEYNVADMALEKITYSFAEDFTDFLMLEQGLENNSAMKHIKNTKHVIKTALERDWVRKNAITGYKCSYIDPDRDILNDDELVLLYSKKMPIKRLEEIRDAYLFMCFTGFAYKDASMLAPEHVTTFFDGEEWIVKNREKTWCRENVPLLPVAKEIIKKYENHPSCVANNTLLPLKSNQKFNAYLKEIVDICGINKNLTTHTARHTFATTVTLANGVPLETVSALLGHKSIRTTQIYAKIVAQKVSSDMKLLKARLSIKMPVSMLGSKSA